MGKILGSNLILGTVENGVHKAVAYSKPCTVEEKREMTEVSSPTSGRWKEYVPGRVERRVTCECLLSDDISTLESAFMAGTPLTVSIRQRSGAGKGWRGQVLITSLRIAGRLHEMASLSVEMTGCGEWRYE